jgi:hypothetical protein
MMDQLQRLAISLTLGLALMAMGHNIDSWEFWCVLALLLVSNFMHYRDGQELGVATAIEMWVDMTEQQRVDMIKLVKEARAEE